MKRAVNILAIAATAVCYGLSLIGCEDTPNVGNSLVEGESEVVIYSDFTLKGRTVDNPRVQSRTVTQVLGNIDARGYGEFTSDFMTQFMPSATIAHNITRDNIDSLKLLFYVPNGSFVGDSVVPMGLEIYRLNKQLPAQIFSNESPDAYYNPSDLLASKIYACNALGANDSIQSLSYRLIDVKMPLSLAHELYDLYVSDPNAYAFPSSFAQHFPGIYVKNSYGKGRVVEISSTMMRLYYHTTTTDSDGNETISRHQGNYYAVTPEIILNNHLTYSISDELSQRIADGEKIVVAPVGRDVELEFPIRDVIDYYNTNSGSMSVVNTLTLDIPAEKIANDYGIDPPEHLLLILSDKKDDFFLRNELNNDITSFYAVYDSTNHRYRFTGLRNYLNEMMKKDQLTPADYTFTLTPVEIKTEIKSSSSYYYSTSTSYVSAINPYIGAPAMVKLNLDDAQLRFTFSKQTLD